MADTMMVTGGKHGMGQRAGDERRVNADVVIQAVPSRQREPVQLEGEQADDDQPRTRSRAWTTRRPPPGVKKVSCAEPRRHPAMMPIIVPREKGDHRAESHQYERPGQALADHRGHRLGKVGDRGYPG